ncbi:MAG: electron transfer flavoprotein subunit alpha/FixB family protein [Candidatus Methanomethylicia archaeon]
MKEVLVIAEHREGELRSSCLETISKAHEVAGKGGLEVTSVIIGSNIKPLAEKLREYVGRVYLAENPEIKYYDFETYKHIVSKLIREVKPLMVLMGHTSYGMDLMPGLSSYLNLPLVTDCIDIELNNGRFNAIRQAYGGRVNVKVSLKPSETYLATLRAGIFQPAKPIQTKGEIVEVGTPPLELKVKHLEVIKPEIEDIDISKADIVIGVGLGIGAKEKIPVVEELAKTLGGVLGCSRPIVDRGWLPQTRQIGFSGKSIKPKIYIAVGISGAANHVAGIKGAKTIVAINKDPGAPIFNVSDYGIVGDLFQVIPIFIQELKKFK